MKRVGIVGSRGYSDLEAVRRFVRGLPSGTLVVTGDARGVDKTATEEAKVCGLEVEIHRADWAEHGRGAGLKRNPDIINGSDEVAVFWDGTSPGTHDSLTLAMKAGKLLALFQTSES